MKQKHAKLALWGGVAIVILIIFFLSTRMVREGFYKKATYTQQKCKDLRNEYDKMKNKTSNAGIKLSNRIYDGCPDSSGQKAFDTW